MKSELVSKLESTVRRLPVILLTFVLILVAAAGLSLKVAAQSTEVPIPPQQIEEVRLQMNRLLATLSLLAVRDEKMAANLAELRQRFASLTDEHLTVMAKSLDLPKLAKSVSDLEERLTRAIGEDARQRMAAFSAGDHPLDPPGYDLCGIVRSDTATGIALLNTRETLEYGVIAADAFCQTIFVAAGFGQNIAGCIAYEIIKTAQQVVTQVLYNFNFCDGIIEGVETLSILNNTHHLHADLAASVENEDLNAARLQTAIGSSTDTITAQLLATENTIIVTILNRVDKLAAEMEAFRADNLRLLIETNLVSESRYTHARFFMPQAAGGHLELVRRIVADTIAMQKKAGIIGDSIEKAEMALSAGDQAFKSGAYKQAYASYRLAYLTMTILPTLKEP